MLIYKTADVVHWLFINMGVSTILVGLCTRPSAVQMRENNDYILCLSYQEHLLELGQYRRTSFNCVVKLLCSSLFSNIANLTIASAQIARRGGLLIE